MPYCTTCVQRKQNRQYTNTVAKLLLYKCRIGEYIYTVVYWGDDTLRGIEAVERLFQAEEMSTSTTSFRELGVQKARIMMRPCRGLSKCIASSKAPRLTSRLARVDCKSVSGTKRSMVVRSECLGSTLLVTTSSWNSIMSVSKSCRRCRSMIPTMRSSFDW